MNSSILPPGVQIERIYDRKDLIDITTHTVLHNMVVGILLIVLLQWIFLGDLRSALIVGATIPFALFFAVIILVLRGESANLLSVGAIDFGLIVDATVIMVEAIFRRLAQTTALSEAERSHISFETAMGMKSHAILSAAADVSRSIFFAAAIIIAAFLPLFTLSGVEGNIFGPMARTYAYALAGGMLATFTVTPALSAIILPSHMDEAETWIVKKLDLLYVPVLSWAIANRKTVMAGAALLVVMTIAFARLLGLEFLPKLEEGNLWIRHRGHAAGLCHQQQHPAIDEGDSRVIGLAEVEILAACAGQPRGQLGPDESAQQGEGAARHPDAENQERRVYLPRHHAGIDEDAGADDAAHHQHRGVEYPQLAPDLGFFQGCRLPYARGAARPGTRAAVHEL